jgi:hypothetical protein
MVYKDMCNDIRRLVAVYILSIPIEQLLSGRAESTADFTQDMFNDIISLIFYYEIAKNFKAIRGDGFKTVVAKNTILLTVNEYLTNKTLTLTKFSSSMAITMGLYFIAKPALRLIKENTGVNTSNFEDSLGTIVALSLANNSIYDTAAKAISLFIFHYALKW